MDPSAEVLLFALEREDGMGGLDLYVSFRETGPGQGFLGRLQTGERWTEPLSLGATINTAGMEGSVFLAADGKTLYFSSDGRSGYGGFDMYLSRRLDDSWIKWSEPLNLGPTINSGRDEYYYTIPATGDYAYFSSDLSGNPDLYRIRLPRAARPDPVTLVQASLDGDKPKIEARFRVIQFDENQEKVSERVAEDGEDQVAFIVPGSIGSSLKIEADGYFPVYRSLGPSTEEGLDYDPEDPVGEAQARVDEVWTPAYRDSLKQALLDSIQPALRAEVEDKMRAELEEEMRAEAEKISIAQAELEERLRKEIEVELRAELSNQIRRDLERKLRDSLDPVKPSSESVEIAKAEERIIEGGVDDILRDDPDSEGEVYQDVVQDIRLVPLEAGQIVRLDNVYFAANKAYLRKESKEELLMVADFLKAHDELVVEIGGHTNGLPGTDFCQKLSDARSTRVVEFLIEEGVPKDRLQAKGYGKTEPIASNETIEGRKKNQRVEIKILEVRGR
jgi:outer membrane protein OmpA-like peptidoglycan-associated protein